MSNDAQWVEDVHRWYYGGTAPASYQNDFSDVALCGEDAIGYEAAHPALQAQHWPDAPQRVSEPSA